MRFSFAHKANKRRKLTRRAAHNSYRGRSGRMVGVPDRPSFTTTVRLHRRTLNGTVGAEHAAVPSFRAKDSLTRFAFVEELTCVGGHDFALRVPALRARQNGFENEVRHQFTSSQSRENQRLLWPWSVPRSSFCRGRSEPLPFSCRSRPSLR
jgi:hypothetical protein